MCLSAKVKDFIRNATACSVYYINGTDIFDRFKQKQKEFLNERAVCSSLTIL